MFKPNLEEINGRKAAEGVFRLIAFEYNHTSFLTLTGKNQNSVSAFSIIPISSSKVSKSTVIK